ncbi:hypothetical protein RclHR1_04800007 [Rhizophagus clarus]|uniref:RZ-type domain-containing protein n=1 Tax=Rhizophagus clarus TaxID=94130 RepID=A0A2Z6SCP2_9GLOM|nr:hypothetical protein RclHR1_04800007 [Rhizophagus clarus]
MFKRSGTNNSNNGYSGITQMLANSDNNSENDEIITGDTEKYMPPYRREGYCSPPRNSNFSPIQRNHFPSGQRNYSPPRQRNYNSPKQRNYSLPRQHYSHKQRDYSPHRKRNYSPPRQSNYLQSKQRNYSPPSPRQKNYTPLNISKQLSSSELTYKGSDRIVFITNGEEIKDSWEKILRKKSLLNQHDVRIFVSSALLTADSQIGYEVVELVKGLGSPEGIKKLREIINFPSMSCDAGLDNRVLSFQYVVLPLLGLLTRTAITECTLENYVHAIFMVVYTNLDSFLYNDVMKMLETLVDRNSLVDHFVSDDDLLLEFPYSFIPTSLGVFFLVIVRLVTELLIRIKETTINETMCNITRDLQRLKTAYQRSIEQQPPSPTSTDPLINNLETRKFFFDVLEKEMKVVNNMLYNRPTIEKTPKQLNSKSIANVFYDPPGELSKNGRRHDNDFENISEISIIPTKEEVLCDRQPFLPSSLPNTPHFLPDGMARLLDTQFRLLREDMLSVVRSGITNFISALLNDWSSLSSKNNRELKNIQEKGGKFRYDKSNDLQVYTGIQFVDIVCDKRKGFSCTIKFTPPNIRSARNLEDRIEHWKKCKKLQVGNLVSLLLPNRNIIQAQSNNFGTNDSSFYSIYFGVVVQRDERNLAGYDRATIGINFIDSSIYPIALDEILNYDKITKKSLEKRFMLESTGVPLETYYHTLKTLQSTNPFILPFEKYLAPNLDNLRNNNNDIVVDNPLYTRAPGFQFDLSVLCKNEEQDMKLNVADSSTHDEVAKNITKYSRLDETQAKALIFALTREITLIQGPPGTGKTVVGVEIMKVLLAKENRKTKIGPILTICFTNHALDQFLEHLLDANIKNIVRLGSRSKSERIKDFNLEVLCKNRNKKKQSYLIAKLHRELESIEDKVNNITLARTWMSWDDVREYLMIEERNFYKKFDRVTRDDLPSWVLGTNEEEFLVNTAVFLDVEEDRWINHQDKRKKNLSIFEKWVKGEDIKTIKKRKEVLSNAQNSKEDNKKDNKKVVSKNTYELLEEYKETDLSDDESQIDDEMMQWIKNYDEPKSDRPLSTLLNDFSIWQMSILERQRLHDYWRTKVHDDFVKKLSKLQRIHEELRKKMDDVYNIENRQVLLESDVIGATTNGAAKYQDLIRSINPKIIICEEAGEVLEAHILSALTPSTQHLILIGDHNQLRPHISTYSLGMDSKMGRNYQLDKSLFERLVNGDRASKVEKVQLLTQRRMRKGEISDLIRYTLYPNLIDGENTTKYPNVRGAQHNVYFINHRHPEDNSDSDLAIQSHANTYEVKMVVEMVKYFVRNGYTKPDDIAVLTPYLGQMMKIKEALAESFVVVIDERDEKNIVEMEEEQKEKESENISVASKKSLNHQVTLRTVDNFQGEEANIVIVSLVRNFSKSSDNDSIGFLKSSNRTNVLLSRAREGMYLIGNAELMAMDSEDIWAPVIEMLKTRNQVGSGMPIVCNQHPQNKNIITKPEQFEQFSPDGGCYEKCKVRLTCGHACTYKCHSDNPKHIGIKCFKPCAKPQQKCKHPCQKQCFEKCGRCDYPIGKLVLPCDHELSNAKCWQEQEKETFYCREYVTRELLYCEHSKCSTSVENVKCREKCKKLLECGHECLSECFECQNYSLLSENSKNKNKVEIMNKIERIQHGKCKRICEKLLFCGHICKQHCHRHEGNDCPPCENRCSVSCEHATCNKNCIEPCAVCAEKCLWKCEHQGKCELSCGAPCFRLPCNERCDKKLECGHLCAGVCGETCPSKDFCVNCASEKVKSQVPDMIMNTIFSEINWNEERMIVLSCGHVYTMETMDSLMGMEDYYRGSIDGRWASIKVLPSLPTDIKKCPTCRAPIKNIRREITEQVIFIKEEMTGRRNQLMNNLYILIKSEVLTFENHNVMDEKSSEVTPFDYFENIERYHGFSKVNKGVWINHVKKLLNCYEELTSIICDSKMPPHKKTFEAAISNLYQAKLNISSSLASTSLDSSVSESQLNFQELSSQIGISVPQMDHRIYLDAFFEIITIQKILYHEILFIIQNTKPSHSPALLIRIVKYKEQKERWKKFAEKLQISIQGHLYTIRQIAESSRYGRHCLLANVEIIELRTSMLKLQLKYPPDEVVDKTLQTYTIEKCEETKKTIVNMIEYCTNNNVEKEFKDFIFKKLDDLQKECDEIQVCAENLRKPISFEEKLEIHRAMQTEFVSSGHWYECPNGHPYTIGECGRAWVKSVCPDCNAVIGGESHRLTSGNEKNSEFSSFDVELEL